MSVSVVALALLTGLAASTVGFVQARRDRDRARVALADAEAAEQRAENQRQEAERQKEQAQNETQRAIAVEQLLTEMLSTANPNFSRGADYTVRELMDDISADLDRRFEGQPLVKAKIRSTVGVAYQFLGDIEKAIDHLSRAAEIYRDMNGADSFEYGRALAPLAMSKTLKAGSSGPFQNPFADNGRADAEESVAILSNVREPKDPDFEAALAFAHFTLGYVASHTELRHAAAQQHYRDGLRVLDTPRTTRAKSHKADLLSELAASLLRNDERLEKCRRHEQHEFAAAMLALRGVSLLTRCDYRNAENAARDSMMTLKKHSPRFSFDAFLVKSFAAQLLIRTEGGHAEGQEILVHQLPLLRTFLLHPDTPYEPQIMVASGIADFDEELRAKWLDLAFEACKSASEGSKASWWEMERLLTLARIHGIRGDLDDARNSLDRYDEIRWPGWYARDINAVDIRIRLLGDDADPAEVEQLHRQLLATWQQECPENHPAPILARCRLADYLTSVDRHGEASMLLDSALQECDREGSKAQPFHMRRVLESLLNLSTATGDSAAGDRWQSRLQATETTN